MEHSYDEQEWLKLMRKGGILPERSREYWSQDERDQLATMYTDGTGISQMALQLQRSEQAVMQQLMVTGLMTSTASRKARVEKLPHCLCDECQMQENCEKCTRCSKMKEGC